MRREDGRINMLVRFGRRHGEKTLGRIIAINPKNFKVETLETRGMRKTHIVGGKWTVPPALCEPAIEE